MVTLRNAGSDVAEEKPEGLTAAGMTSSLRSRSLAAAAKQWHTHNCSLLSRGTRAELSAGQLFLRYQRPNPLQWQFGSQLLRELFIVLEDRLQEVTGIPKPDRKEALAGLLKHR